MQATQPRRYVFTGTAIAAVAAAIILTAVLALTSLESDGVSRSDVSLPAAIQFDQISFMEANTQQIPYTAQRVLSHEEMALWEANTMQVPYVAPVLSSDEIGFLEVNTQQTPYVAPGHDYTGTLPEE